VRRALGVVCVAVVAAVSLAACGSGGAGGGSAGGRLQVVASLYPLAEAAREVGGDRVEVTDLTPPGTEPHDLELTPRAIDRIEDASVVLYLGGGFQPAVERAVGRTQGEAVDLLSADLDLLEGRHDEEEHGDEEPGEEEHEEGTDPHVWLDPVLMKRIAERVQVALSAADPANRAAYEANAAAYAARLDALHASFEEGLRQCDRRVIVTSHAAFGYLARRYGLTMEPISGLSPESEPEPRRLAELADKVRAEGVTTVFYETLVSPRVAETLAREAGVRTAVLNPIEGLDDEERRAGATYLSVMGENLAALRTALGCR
jgi:zinc transport system substrate-binding protein